MFIILDYNWKDGWSLWGEITAILIRDDHGRGKGKSFHTDTKCPESWTLRNISELF